MSEYDGMTAKEIAAQEKESLLDFDDWCADNNELIANYAWEAMHYCMREKTLTKYDKAEFQRRNAEAYILMETCIADAYDEYCEGIK